MNTRILGSNRLAVSAVGFGCMGLNHNRGPALDQTAADHLLRSAFDQGVTLFDTAEHYGPNANEEMVGHALAPIRDQVVIATKFGVEDIDGKRLTDSSPANIRRSVEASLKRLGTDYIDLYYQHFVDPETPVEAVAETVGQLMREGKVLHWGLVKPGADYIRKAHAILPLTAVAAEYSMLSRKPENTLFPLLKELDIGFVAISPLAKGFLTGNLGTAPVFAPGDTRPKSDYLKPGSLMKNQPLLQLLQECAAAHSTTVSAVSLAWSLAQYPELVPVPGCKHADRLLENVKAGDLVLSPVEVLTITRKLDELQTV